MANTFDEMDYQQPTHNQIARLSGEFGLTIAFRLAHLPNPFSFIQWDSAPVDDFPSPNVQSVTTPIEFAPVAMDTHESLMESLSIDIVSYDTLEDSMSFTEPWSPPSDVVDVAAAADVPAPVVSRLEASEESLGTLGDEGPYPELDVPSKSRGRVSLRLTDEMEYIPRPPKPEGFAHGQFRAALNSENTTTVPISPSRQKRDAAFYSKAENLLKNPSKSPVMDAFILCVHNKRGAFAEYWGNTRIAIRVFDVSQLLATMSRIIVKESPTNSASSRWKTLKRWFRCHGEPDKGVFAGDVPSDSECLTLVARTSGVHEKTVPKIIAIAKRFRLDF